MRNAALGLTILFRNRIMFCEEFHIVRHFLLPWIIHQQTANTATHPVSINQDDAGRNYATQHMYQKNENKNLFSQVG